MTADHLAPDERWDVVVVGLGDAGAAAAIEAHDRGARVLVLEAQAADDHRPNSRYAAGFFIVPDDRHGAGRYLRGLYAAGLEDDVGDDLVDAWVTEAAAIVPWLDAHGCPHEPFAAPTEHGDLDGADAIVTRRITYRSDAPGCPLHAFLVDQVRARSIEVRHGRRVRRLLTERDGIDVAVAGVEVDEGDGPRTIGAGAVVLATGGYEGNAAMQRQLLGPWPVHFLGTRRNDGSGIHLAAAVGADLWHLNVWPGRLVAHVPDSGYDGGVSLQFRGNRAGRAPGGLFVDAAARRFMAEPGLQHAAHHHALGYDPVRRRPPRIPAWWVFDRARLDAGPLPPVHSGAAGPLRELEWSDDNRVEIGRGWIRTGDTIAGLARACGLDPAALEATVGRYHDACAAGVDAEFGRPSETLTPLTEPPFAAIELWPGGTHTLGGPRRDGRARVVRPDRTPIEGLYACGELGSMYGLLYPSGGASLTECLAFGRVAGREAAARAGVTDVTARRATARHG